MMDFRAFLPLEKWGLGEAKTLKELQAEIEAGESRIIWKSENEPVRTLRVARVFVTYKSRQLVETKQVMLDGRVRHRHIVGISEKLHAGEGSEMGAIRGLKEELGIEVSPTFLEFVGVAGEEKYSKSYPGLLCRYDFFDYKCEMPDAFFREEYIAEEEGSTTYFGWDN